MIVGPKPTYEELAAALHELVDMTFAWNGTTFAPESRHPRGEGMSNARADEIVAMLRAARKKEPA